MSQLTILDIPFQSTTMTINDACKKFGISRQMIDKLINDKKIFVFSTGLSDRGKLMISTYDLIEKANLFPKEALVEIFKMEYEKKKPAKCWF
ncbi:MAG: helix-turn-helix domain-containing protein [Crenarchaeota archaeon]|nr:helix-turn-helix domain-containing protein [Thermoproteota archaeon]